MEDSPDRIEMWTQDLYRPRLCFVKLECQVVDAVLQHFARCLTSQLGAFDAPIVGSKCWLNRLSGHLAVATFMDTFLEQGVYHPLQASARCSSSEMIGGVAQGIPIDF